MKGTFYRGVLAAGAVLLWWMTNGAFSAPIEKGFYAMFDQIRHLRSGEIFSSCNFPFENTARGKRLSPEQHRIMKQNGTELPFANPYWDNKKPGLYVDAISGEPLFSSTDKFDSGTGWPSFTAPVLRDNVEERLDTSHGMRRVEVRSKKSDSHLGHVFDDGPAPAGRRYCINSAALRFIPAENLQREGYGEYLAMFGDFPESKTETAVFGAGCFWGVESAFRRLPGIVRTTAGYMGGTTEDPSYEEVCTDRTGHAEVVKVEFDPAKISYHELLEVFWNLHDPTTLNRQGPDLGTQYRSVIFTENSAQEKSAMASLEALARSGKLERRIVTQIVPAKEFYPAEEYHQQYFEKRGIKPVCHLPKDPATTAQERL
jgi:peptide methionine sulfoxide reductase msrA/msrB